MEALLPEDEQARLAALERYGILDTDPEEAYDAIVRLAAFICGTPIAAVTLVDSQRQWFKSALGLDLRETPRTEAFCSHTILRADLTIVPDVLADERFTGNPLVIGDPNIRFYAGAPLITSEGFSLGSLCVIDTVPRNLTTDQEAALATLARQVTSQMELTRQLCSFSSGCRMISDALRLPCGEARRACRSFSKTSRTSFFFLAWNQLMFIVFSL